MPGRPSMRSPLEKMQMALAAQLFYRDGRNKSQVADELGVSRFKVARLLADALREGVVTIEIHPSPEVDVDRSVAVSRRFGLRQALVVRLPEGPEQLRREQLGRAAAAALGDLLSEGDVLGVAWGRTLQAMAHGLAELPTCSIVQIVGSVPTSDLSINSLDLVRAMAARAGGEMYALQVPMVLDSPQTAAVLRQDPYVAATLAMFPRLTRAVVGIGGWQGTESALTAVLPIELRDRLQAAGAVADISCTVLDVAGVEVTTGDLPGRCIAINAAELRAVPDVIAVSGGVERVTAIRAALRSGLVHRLITDDATAAALLG